MDPSWPAARAMLWHGGLASSVYQRARRRSNSDLAACLSVCLVSAVGGQSLRTGSTARRPVEIYDKRRSLSFHWCCWTMARVERAHAFCLFIVNLRRCPPPRHHAILSYLSPVKTRTIRRRNWLDRLSCRPATGRLTAARALGNYIRASMAAGSD